MTLFSYDPVTPIYRCGGKGSALAEAKNGGAIA